MAAQINLTVNVVDDKLKNVEERIKALTTGKAKTIKLAVSLDPTSSRNLAKIERVIDYLEKDHTVSLNTSQVDTAQEKLNEIKESKKEIAQKTSLGLDTQGLKGLAKDYKAVAKAAKEADKSAGSLFKTIAKNARDYLIRQSVIALTNSFREALDTIKQVDTELATIKKVTDFSDAQMKTIERGAYSTASKYGVNANEYLESVAEFAKAGYKTSSQELGELAIKTQLVGDVTADTADKFLLAVDAAWKYHGSVSELSTVLDKANIVENNFATSIDKIAQGLPNVASVASMAGMSVDETIAAIGTITAVTQQSASKASTALRALILNILGDTNTAFENEYGEFVKWTENETEVLRGLLNKYAAEVVKTADATGTLINPIEAIRALGKAFDDGKLSAAQLEGTLQQIGGKLRTNQLVALVENVDMLDQMLGLMGESAGSADKEIEVMLDTWEAKANILKNTWTEFVSTSFSSDFFKGALTGLTNIIKAIGSMPTLIYSIAAAVAMIKMDKISASFGKLRDNIKAMMSAGGGGAKGFFKSLASGANLARIAVAGLAIAFIAITKAIDNYKQQLADAVKVSTANAEKEKEDADNVAELNKAYYAAKTAYEEGKGSKEAYIIATNQLATALGLEGEAIDKVQGKIKSLSLQEINEAEGALGQQIQATLNQGFGSEKVGIGAELSGKFRRGLLDYVVTNDVAYGTDIEKANAIINYYENINNKLKEYGEKAANNIQLTKEEEADRKRLSKILAGNSEIYDSLKSALESLNELDGQRADIQGEVAGKIKENAWAEDTEIRTLANMKAQYDGLTESVNKAKNATAEFAEATKEELDSAYKSYASVYEKFLADWNAGLHGSNVVLSAMETIFSDEQIANMFAKGMNLEEIGELLSSKFYQDIFSAKGEDRGTILAEWLFGSDAVDTIDEQGNRIIQVGGKIAATLRDDGDSIAVTVNDFDLLAKAMEEIGVPISAEYLASWLQAMGMYSPAIEVTTNNIREMAKAMEALTETGEIDLDKFITGLKLDGASATYIMQIVDALIKARDEGKEGIVLKVDVAEGETETEHIAKLIGQTIEDANNSTAELDVDTSEAETAIGRVKAQLENITNRVWNITVSTIVGGNAGGAGAVRGGISGLGHKASGTSSAPEGASMVNENGAEIIWNGRTARIAGNGKPTITWLNRGDTVYNASQTRQILGGINESSLYGGINAYALGTSSMLYDGGGGAKKSIAVAIGNAANAAVRSALGDYFKGTNSGTASAKKNYQTSGSSGGGSGSGSGSGGGSSSNEKKDPKLEQLEDLVKYYESVRDVVEARGGGVKEQVKAITNIQNALQNQINYMKSIGASQTEINKLTAQWYKLNDDIAKLQKEMFDELQDAIKNEIDKVNEKRDAEKDKIQEQIDALKEAKDVEEDQLELEEKILAVQEAEEKLRNAQLERTVRMYNATTGQWEWVANSRNVQAATEELLNAQQALKEFRDKLDYESAVKKLEEQQDAVDQRYDKIVSDWEKISESLDTPAKTISEVLAMIGANATSSQAGQINSLNSMLAQFGYKITPKYDSGGILKGLGGIKATSADEMILPPNITKAMLTPSANSMFQDRMKELALMYGAQGYSMNRSSIGNQYNGNLYQYGNITLTQAQAERTTVAELARMARGLTSYNSAI